MKSNERLVYTYKGKSYYLYFLIIAFLFCSISGFADQKAAPNYSQTVNNPVLNTTARPSSTLPQVLSNHTSDSLVNNNRTNVHLPVVTAPENEPVSSQMDLIQNHPNPFDTQTTISYKLDRETDVELMIYDDGGQIVKILYRGIQSTGNYHMVWNGTDYQGHPCSSGLYIAHLQAGENLCDKRIMLVK